LWTSCGGFEASSDRVELDAEKVPLAFSVSKWLHLFATEKSFFAAHGQNVFDLGEYRRRFRFRTVSSSEIEKSPIRKSANKAPQVLATKPTTFHCKLLFTPNHSHSPDTRRQPDRVAGFRVSFLVGMWERLGGSPPPATMPPVLWLFLFSAHKKTALLGAAGLS
jgi:hypothetical protein